MAISVDKVKKANKYHFSASAAATALISGALEGPLARWTGNELTRPCERGGPYKGDFVV